MIKINTTERIIPMMYAYSTPEIKRHNGWLKIGYTDRQTVEERVKQQTKTSDTLAVIEWKSMAVYDDGSGDSFKDYDFHSYLQKCDVRRLPKTEWFNISVEGSKQKLMEFKQNKGVLLAKGTSTPYELRDEQKDAVEKTIAYFEKTHQGEFLWNAKPRFGKTLACYDLCKRLKSKNAGKPFHVLIVTNRPAIANSWYDDFVKFLGDESGFAFVSETDTLKGKPYVITRQQYVDSVSPDNIKSAIEFVSLQDLKGSLHFGGRHDKLAEIKQMTWDLLVVDEAHEGVDTAKTDNAFYQIKRNFTLHLSGTPFKALANDKFPDDAIYNWTYADEQKAKRDWDYERGNNPYEPLPRLNLFTYQMSEIVRSEIEKGIDIDGNTEEYAFDLNLFFETKPDGTFKYDEQVDKFLDSLTTLEKYPFSTDELRDELKHTLWLLNRVDSAKALAKKLKAHPVFGNGYEIVLAAGDGKLDEDEQAKKSLDKVREAIERSEKTITLSVGQLTTGITVPQWTAVLMLSNIKSPALYMQAAFRAQNPWQYYNGSAYCAKKNAYVFDFDPARTLVIFEEFANDLSSKTSGGKGGSDERKQNVRELLNFFPVIGEDDSGKMVELDAEKVLLIPRKIRSLEVVRRGFMSNFLFQNISNIFGAPQEVIDIIQNFQPVKEKDAIPPREKRDDVTIDENGDISLDDEYVLGLEYDLFGEKIYSSLTDNFDESVYRINYDTPEDKQIKELEAKFNKDLVEPIIKVASTYYEDDLKAKDKKAIEKDLKEKGSKILNQLVSDFSIKKAEIENERKNELLNIDYSEKSTEHINNEYDGLISKAENDFKTNLMETINKALPTFTEDVVRSVETKKKEKQKQSIEDSVRNHLRGFSRTIPSFLMAYGDDNTTLESFDTIIPDDVFKEVTSISLDEFRFLRDGGEYIDSDTKEKKHYQGKLFDPVVFNDSVKEFLTLKKRLANYFDESNDEDIFDYIPPQKTNQIYTPKKVVRQMVDMLEEENPGCFDMPDKTFADLYMKSGLYIAEIVKRLYNSKKMVELFPDCAERLNHIFENQVYGLAPTQIIYRIAVNFILGFDNDNVNRKHNFRMLDALPYAKAGTLDKKLDEIFT